MKTSGNLIRCELSALLLLTSAATWAAEAMITLPDTDVPPGDMFEVPVYVTDGDVNLASYSLRLSYAPDIVNVLEISGGVSAGFNAAPVTNPASFASGDTDFTAINDGFVATPAGMFEVARVRLQAVGRPGDASPITLDLTPNGGLVDSASFSLIPATVTGSGEIRLIDDGSGGTLPPNPPANLLGSAKGQRVMLDWVGASDADSFRVFRLLLGESDYAEIGTTVERSYMDSVPRGIGWASYYVVAENIYGASDASSSVGVIVQSRRRSRR